jgi:hypothetical protein
VSPRLGYQRTSIFYATYWDRYIGDAQRLGDARCVPNDVNRVDDAYNVTRRTLGISVVSSLVHAAMEKEDESGRPFVGLALLAMTVNMTDKDYEKLASTVDWISKSESIRGIARISS